MGFFDELQKTKLELFNDSVTENGAVGYRTTGKALLDLNFAVSSLRSVSAREIQKRFTPAFYEDEATAFKWLFFARDVRGGLGERRLFRILLPYALSVHPECASNLIQLVPEYGRFDDLLCLLDHETPEVKKAALAFIQAQLTRDWVSMNDKKPISLLSKWLPSPNASSKETKRQAKEICKYLGMNERNYRKLLSGMRAYLNIVETKMASNQWESIKYEAVPSRANLIYNKAFLRHDEARRRDYLAKLAKGETKINAATLFPHDIVHKYRSAAYTRYVFQEPPVDPALEALWKSLPDTVTGKDGASTIVVADGSGSMTMSIGKTELTALEVANALAIYFAEKLSGEFRDRYITFSAMPKLVDFSTAKTLRDKLIIAKAHNEVANTNLEAVFDLILDTAVRGQMLQEDIPANILIISDMEFDEGTTMRYRRSGVWGFDEVKPSKRLFDQIRARYEAAGYKLPRLVFWNVNSRTGTIPVRENDLGVALVSGFSPNVARMVMSGKLDPYECLLETLNGERYRAVEAAVEPFFGNQ